MALSYNLLKPWETLDPWQEEVIAEQGHTFCCCGRQRGKSTAYSIKTGEYAINHPDEQTMVIAFVERQAFAMFEKILAYLDAKYPGCIKPGHTNRTKSKANLKNGHIIRCLPTGLTGAGIRGYTIHKLVIDEAHFIPEAVFTALIPMLAVTGGTIDVCSTPKGREGFFYDCSKRDDFKKWFMSAEDNPRQDKEHLKREKDRMTKLQYAQEYLGQFIADLKQWWSDDLIRECMKLGEGEDFKEIDILPNELNDYFLGVDIGHRGVDVSAFEGLDGTDDERIIHVSHETTSYTRTTDTTRKILELENRWQYTKIGLDDGGVGAGVLDQCLEEDDIKRKTVGLNNARRAYDNKKGSKKLMKEEMYVNLLRMMERGHITLLKNAEVFSSLKSVQYEYSDGNLKIFGNNTHIAEALIRAAQLIKTKGLRSFIG